MMKKMSSILFLLGGGFLCSTHLFASTGYQTCLNGQNWSPQIPTPATQYLTCTTPGGQFNLAQCVYVFSTYEGSGGQQGSITGVKIVVGSTVLNTCSSDANDAGSTQYCANCYQNSFSTFLPLSDCTQPGQWNMINNYAVCTPNYGSNNNLQLTCLQAGTPTSVQIQSGGGVNANQIFQTGSSNPVTTGNCAQAWKNDPNLSSNPAYNGSGGNGGNGSPPPQPGQGF